MQLLDLVGQSSCRAAKTNLVCYGKSGQHSCSAVKWCQGGGCACVYMINITETWARQSLLYKHFCDRVIHFPMLSFAHEESPQVLPLTPRPDVVRHKSCSQKCCHICLIIRVLECHRVIANYNPAMFRSSSAVYMLVHVGSYSIFVISDSHNCGISVWW